MSAEHAAITAPVGGFPDDHKPPCLLALPSGDTRSSSPCTCTHLVAGHRPACAALARLCHVHDEECDCDQRAAGDVEQIFVTDELLPDAHPWHIRRFDGAAKCGTQPVRGAEAGWRTLQGYEPDYVCPPCVVADVVDRLR